MLAAMHSRLGPLALGSLLLLGCGPEGLVTRPVVGRGVVNDPQNKSLRFDVMKFGLDEFCREMRERGVPLRLRDEDPNMGRFSADSCSSQVIDQDTRKSLIVQYSGRGYVWTALTLRVGFTTAGVVEYAPDFQVHEVGMYVYFRPRNIHAASFETQLVESELAKTTELMGISVPVDGVGQHVVNAQLERGFTVIRYEEGQVDFGLGYVPVGQRPFKPFRVEHSRKLTLANDRTEVHVGQQDIIGAFEIEKRNQALYLTLTLDGAPAVDVLALPKGQADQMLARYITERGPALLPAPPIFEQPLVAGRPFKAALPLPEGHYSLILDNSAVVGGTTPQATAGDDRAAAVDYLVQLGKR